MEEDIIDTSADGGTEVEEFSVYPVKGGLEKVPLSGVLRVKEFEKIEDKGLVNVSLCKVCVEIGALDETKEEFIYNLEVRPCEF